MIFEQKQLVYQILGYKYTILNMN